MYLFSTVRTVQQTDDDIINEVNQVAEHFDGLMKKGYKNTYKSILNLVPRMEEYIKRRQEGGGLGDEKSYFSGMEGVFDISYKTFQVWKRLVMWVELQEMAERGLFDTKGVEKDERFSIFISKKGDRRADAARVDRPLPVDDDGNFDPQALHAEWKEEKKKRNDDERGETYDEDESLSYTQAAGGAIHNKNDKRTNAQIIVDLNEKITLLEEEVISLKPFKEEVISLKAENTLLKELMISSLKMTT
jgi:hypothetical protein